MPRRAAPGDRRRIEEALTPTLLSALNELRELFDIRGDWQSTGIAAPFQAAACVLEAARLVRQGHAPHTALEIATARLGLEVSTVRSWCARWSAVHVAHTPWGTSATSLIRDAAALPAPEDEAA